MADFNVIFSENTSSFTPGSFGTVALGLSAYQLAVANEGYAGTLTEWLASLAGVDGRGIVSAERTEGDGTPGTTDIYTVTYTDEATSTFTVYNGADGVGGAGGDMTKAVYDTDDDGKVDAAEDAIRWNPMPQHILPPQTTHIQACMNRSKVRTTTTSRTRNLL